jgi:serine/threonine protein kinase
VHTGGLGLPLADDADHRFVRLTSQGGLSRVQLAERADDGMLIVPKVLDGRQIRKPSITARFVREAAIIAAIEDLRAVRIHGQGFTPDSGYLALELYSAGIVFCEPLTGHKGFRAECASSLAYQHLHAPPTRLPAALAVAQPVIDILLAKRPEERFASANELRTALDGW